MVTVKLFGLFRLDTGLKEIKAEASSVKELYPILLDEAKKVNPTTMITAADIDGCSRAGTFFRIGGRAQQRVNTADDQIIVVIQYVV